MQASDSLAALLESALNGYIGLDPEAKERLAPLHGRIVELQVVGLGVRLFLVPGPGGIQVFRDSETPPDCTLKGSPLALAGMASERARADQLFSGSVEITGDTDLGHELGKLIGGLDVDWEEQLSRVTGDVLAHQVGNLVRGSLRWWGMAADTLLRQDLPEYLQEEVRLVPSRHETEYFLSEVDRLRDDAERLEQRLRRLRSRVPEAGNDRA